MNTCNSCKYFRISPDDVTYCQNKINTWVKGTKIENIFTQGVFGEFTYRSTEACSDYEEVQNASKL